MNRSQKIRLLQLEIAKEKKQCERFYNFVKAAWHIVEPKTPFVDNWHFKFLCDILEEEIIRIAERRPRNKHIVINISPRASKSTIVSVMLVPWTWRKYPHIRFINSSHSNELSTLHCVQSRTIIDSQWYQRNWGNSFSMTTDQNVKSFFINTSRGHRIATSVGGSIGGFGGDVIISDDLINPKKAMSEAHKKASNEHFDVELYNRLNDPDVGMHIIVQQRVCADDTTDHAMKADPDQFRHICIPAEANDVASPSSILDNYVDGLFFPARFNKETLSTIKRRLGSRAYTAQYGQNPLPDGGNIVNPSWWKFYRDLDMNFDKMIQSWDLSFEEGANNSYTIGQVWGKKGKNAFLVYQYRKQIGFTDALKAFNHVTAMFPKAHKKIVEKKANGHALLDVLKSKVPGLSAKTPTGSKAARLSAVSPNIESGFVYIPHPDSQDWVSDYINELAVFTGAKNGKEINDQVDATSQALEELFGSWTYEDMLAD